MSCVFKHRLAQEKCWTTQTPIYSKRYSWHALLLSRTEYSKYCKQRFSFNYSYHQMSDFNGQYCQFIIIHSAFLALNSFNPLLLGPVSVLTKRLQQAIIIARLNAKLDSKDEQETREGLHAVMKWLFCCCVIKGRKQHLCKYCTLSIKLSVNLLSRG